MRLHRRVLAEHRAEARAVVDLHAVIGEDALHLAMLLAADDLRQMLHEVAAARDVQHLEAAADGEHRHVARERAFEQRKLAAVALGLRASRLGVRRGAVRSGSRSLPPENRRPSSASSVSSTPSTLGGTSSARAPARSSDRTYSYGMSAASRFQ